MGQGWSQAGMVAGGGRPSAMTGQRGRGGGVRGRRLRWLPAGLLGNMEDEPVDEPASVEQNMDEPVDESETLDQDPGLSEPDDEPEQPV